jgi:hypothetical protein
MLRFAKIELMMMVFSEGWLTAKNPVDVMN